MLRWANIINKHTKDSKSFLSQILKSALIAFSSMMRKAAKINEMLSKEEELLNEEYKNV